MFTHPGKSVLALCAAGVGLVAAISGCSNTSSPSASPASSSASASTSASATGSPTAAGGQAPCTKEALQAPIMEYTTIVKFTCGVGSDGKQWAASQVIPDRGPSTPVTTMFYWAEKGKWLAEDYASFCNDIPKGVPANVSAYCTENKG